MGREPTSVLAENGKVPHINEDGKLSVAWAGGSELEEPLRIWAASIVAFFVFLLFVLPHSSIGYIGPDEFVSKIKNAEIVVNLREWCQIEKK